jgi:hypothetical protein
MSVSKFMRWMRVVLITDWVLWLMVGAVISTWLLQQLAAGWLKLVAPSNLTEAELGLTETSIHPFVTCVVAYAYGALRVVAFHPIVNKPYGRWLATTPWKYPEPLPLGPIHFAWQDVVLLLILVGLTLLPPWWNLTIVFGVPLAFLAGYCLALGHALYRLETYWALGLYALLAGFALLAISYPPALALVALALIGVSYLAIGALRNFPYTEARRKDLGLAHSELQSEADVYWTIVPLADETYMDLPNALQTTTISLLTGWLMFGVATLPISDFTVGGLFCAHLGVCALAIGGRILRFVSHRFPPITILGRIATGKNIIPGYDRIFIAPLAATVAAILVPALLLVLGVWPALAIALSTMIAVWLALALPPSFKDWYYTGHFHMLRPTVNQQKRPQVRAGT